MYRYFWIFLTSCLSRHITHLFRYRSSLLSLGVIFKDYHLPVYLNINCKYTKYVLKRFVLFLHNFIYLFSCRRGVNLFPNLVIHRFSSRTSGRSFKLLFLNIYSHGSIQASNDKKLTYFSPTICSLKSRDPSHIDFARYPDNQKDFILEG